ncbi:MAG TPA: TetR/AcrR family transcriptional regulator [Polyangia bacterium]
MSSPSPRSDSEQFRKRARAAAVRLFSRHGFEGTSVQAIADELGVSKQALLYHFASKEGLREAALEEIVGVWRTLLPRLLSAMTREGAQFDDVIAEIMAVARGEPAYARFMVQELLQPARPDSIVRNIEPWLSVAGDFIRRAQAEGTIDEDVDPEAWVINFGTLVVSTLSFLDETRTQPGAERVLREMARIAGTSLTRHKTGKAR